MAAAGGSFAVGDKVEIFGLRQAQAHNGKRGVVVGFNSRKQRWNVRVDAASGGHPEPLGVKAGNLKRLAAAPRNTFDDDSLLQCAVQERENRGAGEIARAKLAAGSDPNSCNRAGQTALHVAAIWGSMGVGRALIEAGANVNSRNNINGGTPLMMAAGRNQMEFACMLLENGADPMIKDQGGSVAYQNADDPELRELLGGPSATMVNAVREGDLEKVQNIAKAQPDLMIAKDGSGNTPLAIAIENRYWDMALWFINHSVAELLVNQPGANAGGNQGSEYPLHLAIRAEQADLVDALLKAGANPDLKSIRSGEYSRGNFDRLDAKTGAKEAVTPEHRAPLFLCVESGDIELAQLLLNGGCDVNTTDGDGCTPLYCALEEEQEEMAEALLAAGASVDVGNADIGLDNTLLGWASSLRRLDHVQLLLKHGADPNKSGKSGMYPLHIAARAGGKAVLEALLARGANPTNTCRTHKGCPGVTARQVVEKNQRAVAAGCLEVFQGAQ